MMALIRLRALEIAFFPVMWTQRNFIMIILIGLAAPLPATRVFDFSLQREVNQELGAR
jgi:hypothetical protein